MVQSAMYNNTLKKHFVNEIHITKIMFGSDKIKIKFTGCHEHLQHEKGFCVTILKSEELDRVNGTLTLHKSTHNDALYL